MSTQLQKVIVGGDFFLNEDGSEFHYVGISDFALFKRMGMDNGPEALVRPILIQRRQIADRAGYVGPIVDRTFRCSDPGNIFGQIPDKVRFDLINPFLDLCAEYNTYVDFTQGDDDHGMMFGPSLSGLQNFHNKFTSSIERFCFYETENEPGKNGNAPKHGIIPAPSKYYLRDSGNYVFISDSQAWEYEYDLEFISGHFDRTNDPIRWPKWVCDLDDSLATLRSKVGKPTVLKEPTKFGPGYTDPSYAKCLGLRANMGGVVMHTQLGLSSDGFDEPHIVAVGEYFKGAAGALQ